MGQKRKIELTVESCFECHYHDETDGICGSAEWCSHPKVNKGNSKQICGKDMSLDFPTWCPLISKKKAKTKKQKIIKSPKLWALVNKAGLITWSELGVHVFYNKKQAMQLNDELGSNLRVVQFRPVDV